jgi:hypothetical protein
MEQYPLKDFEDSYTIDRSGNVYGKDKTRPLTTHTRSDTSTTQHIVLSSNGKSVGFAVPFLVIHQFGLGDEWDEVIGYEGLYHINRNGDIYSCTYNKCMKHNIDESGYLFVSLHSKGNPKHKGRIHRLLAIQYIPNPDDLPEVDHIDRNKQNNDLSNLRWVTHSENMLNRKDSLHLKTAEQIEDRTLKIREYKKIKAREYALKKKENHIEETPDQREERLAKHREYCKKSNDKKKNPADPTYIKKRKPNPLEETLEEREERLAKCREYNRRYLEKKKSMGKV